MPSISRTKSYWGVIFLLAILLGSGGVVANQRTAAGQELVKARPEDVGMSSQRLERLDAFFQQAVREGRTAGAVTMIARRGKVVYARAVGMSDREANRPMSLDTIFRICSMTKPITSVAAMMLYEEGRLMLDDPVAKYIPEFGNAKVLAESEGVATESSPTVPAKKPITVRHLLTHTSGLTYQWNERLGPLYHKAGIPHGLIQEEGSLAEKMKRLATLPLLHQPGEKYEYGLSIDVLGYLVEVVSGQSLDAFFRQRIFEPLGMHDTAFFPSPEKLDRLAAVYERSAPGQLRRMGNEPVVQGSFVYSADYPERGPKHYFSGGAGLCSTVPDYMRFCLMLAGGGQFGNTRLLSRKTVEVMTLNQLGELWGMGNQKFGLGFLVLTDRARTNMNWSEGSFGWGGFYNTTFLIDPKEQLIVVSMTQLRPGHDCPISEIVPVLAAQAIVD